MADRSYFMPDDEQQVAEQFAAAIHLAALQIVAHPAPVRERLYATLRRFTYLSSIEAGIGPDQAAELRDAVDLSVHATVSRIELSGPPAITMQ
ncbi:MAG TPA: hypothetical protein PKA20_17490 [Burkholderiaceae bacterium]|nr:hypothetical protein [Burkholderiaceae bacterium]